MLSTKLTSDTGYKQQRSLDSWPFKPRHPAHPSHADSTTSPLLKGKIVVKINTNVRRAAQTLLLLYFLLVIEERLFKVTWTV